jgi:diguanylate cyclase
VTPQRGSARLGAVDAGQEPWQGAWARRKATLALNAAVWFRLGLLIALILCGRYPRPSEQVLHLNASLIFPSPLCSRDYLRTRMSIAQKSLSEQMHITDSEIARRKQLLGFTQSDADLLAAAQSFISQDINDIVGKFYQQQIAIEEIALIIGDSETLQRLHIAQKKYVNSLFAGFYDTEYVNDRLRIGLVHKRIGVAPKHYLAAVKVLRDTIKNAIEANISSEHSRSATVDALDKLLFFDIQFVFDTYIRSLISEIESAKEKVEKYAATLEDKVAERTRELERLSRTDPMTGLLNRRAFREEMRRELTRVQRRSEELSLVYFDVDDFKMLNDTEGHQKGDTVLKSIGQVLLEIKRETDIVSRLGGDEFGVVLPDTNKKGCEDFCQRMTQAFQQQCKGLTLSIGTAHAGPDHYPEIDDLIQIADKQMYEMKRKHHHTENNEG